MSDALAETEIESRKALAMLPREWAEPVAFFAMAKLPLLKTRGPLCANLKYWISKGLTLDDAKRIFRRLCDPDIARLHNFENQLMADMAELVYRALRFRRMLTEMEMRRKEAESSPYGVVLRSADSFKAA